MRRVERHHFDLRLNTYLKQCSQIIIESIGELIGIKASTTLMRRLKKLSDLPNKRMSVLGTRRASATTSNTMPLDSTPP